MSFIYLFLIGILIGTAMIIPGVSGSVIAVVLGIYDKAIYALTNLFKNFKKNFFYLFVIFLGILVGAIWFSNIMIYLYEKNEVITKFCFIGLILGGIPVLFRKTKNSKEGKVNYIALFLTFIISISLLVLSLTVFNIFDETVNYNSFGLFIAGIVYAIGKVVPGVSGSFLLIIMGIYEYILSIIAHPITIGLSEIKNVIPFMVGLIVGVLLLIKIINYLFERHYSLFYSIIIGFVLGSLFALIPFNFLFKDYIIGCVFMACSFLLSYNLTK